MRIIYQQTNQTSFLYGLTRPSLGQWDFMRRLKLFLKKVSLLQLFFEKSDSKNNKKKKLLLVHDDDGTNNRIITTPDATNNKPFGLVNIDNDYPDGRVECQTRKCRTLIIYNNKNNRNHNSKNNVDNISNNNSNNPSQDNRTFDLDDYLDGRVVCGTLTIY